HTDVVSRSILTPGIRPSGSTVRCILLWFRMPEMENPDQCPKVSKKEAVTVSEAVEILRRWRRSSPRATRLDGRSGENCKQGGGIGHWFHIKVDGYGDGDSFKSCHGPVFRGQAYNGIVNFHAD